MKSLISKVMLIITIIAVLCIVSLRISKENMLHKKEEVSDRMDASCRSYGTMIRSQSLC